MGHVRILLLRLKDENKDDDARTRLKNVALKPSAPSRGKLTKAPHRDEKERLRDPEDIDNDELRAQLKLARRENKDQCLELRDLEKEHSQLREAYLRIRNGLSEDPRRFTKSEKNKYVERFHLMDNHIQYQAYELEKRDTHIEMLTKQTRDANSEKDEMESNNRKLQKQIKELNSNLTECKDDLLRLQPSSQISDSEIGERYSNLAQQITSWVDDQTEDSETIETRFEALKSKESLKLDPILEMYIAEAHIKIVQDHPSSLPLLIQYLVHRCLEQYVMGNGLYFFGLDIRDVRILQEAEQGLKLLEPQRGDIVTRSSIKALVADKQTDVATLRRWRSETLQGLSKSQDFATAREHQGLTLAKTLYFALARFIRGPDVQIDDDGWEGLHKQIILPATDLATMMRLSMTDYEVVSRMVETKPDDEVVVHHSEIQHYQMVDCATHKIIRPDSVLKIGEEGRVGRELLTVTPALMRTRNDGVHRVVICKPTILVKLDEPMGKRSKGIKPLGSWTPSWFGGDGQLG